MTQSAPTTRQQIAVTGIARSLPVEFPLVKAENAGNIIHGNAPFSMFPNSHFSVDRSWEGYRDGVSFRDFVNTSCSHLIVTVANLIRVRNSHPTTIERYKQFRARLEEYDAPIVIFGLGAQSDSSDSSQAELPEEAIDLLRFLADRCQAISVRGSYTASLFAKYADDTKVFVTGCPSFYSRPDAFSELHRHLRDGSPGTPAFNGTHYHKPAERALIQQAILAEHFWIEPADPAVHEFYRTSLKEPELAVVPDAFRFLLEGRTPTLTRAQLQTYFTRRYRLFREFRSWRQFTMEHVSFSYGARFHVNMASLLSGRGAYWIRHDSRTRELTDTLHLPSIDLEDAADADPNAPRMALTYEDLFDNVRSLFDYFNEFLDAAGLPQITHPR